MFRLSTVPLQKMIMKLISYARTAFNFPFVLFTCTIHVFLSLVSIYVWIFPVAIFQLTARHFLIAMWKPTTKSCWTIGNIVVIWILCNMCFGVPWDAFPGYLFEWWLLFIHRKWTLHNDEGLMNCSKHKKAHEKLAEQWETIYYVTHTVFKWHSVFGSPKKVSIKKKKQQAEADTSVEKGHHMECE